ncbi:hypothetical protein GLOIN_2v1469483 [Rhizophagus irregularis DAOM 181602=DAOM 197198]|nr:hypothetical protein GLOIN_2v1469483 [Rhizophagus irregularis DAOM 181602=DAOM 197198]
MTPDDFENLEIHPSHNKLWNLYLKNYFHILGKINPNLETILKRAAPPTYPQIRELVLKYFIDNFKRYSKHYNPETVDIAFLPCSNSNGYARPSDCFINDECTIMNLQTIREDLRSKAEKLGVRQIPDYKKLKEKLIENPPQNKNEAKKIFEYLNRFNYNWSSLINIQFIPIQDESKINNKYFKPCDCFFKLKEESLNEFFLCVDFGTKANKFLAKCGVRDPSLYDFAEISVDPSHKSFTDSDWKKLKDFEFIPIQPNELFKPRDCFLKLKEESLNNFFPCVDFAKINPNLETILNLAARSNYPKIRELAFKYFVDNSIFPEKKLNKDDVLIAIKTDSKGNDFYFLATVKEIYINDDKKLGCKSLHESVTKSVVPYGPIQKTKYSRQLQRIIRERASLFYLDHSEEYIRKDEKWLKKLKVREIEYMETSYKLGSITKNERNDITTNISQKNTISWILYVTPNSNLIDISQQLVNHIFTSHYQNTSYFNNFNSTFIKLKKYGNNSPKITK